MVGVPRLHKKIILIILIILFVSIPSAGAQESPSLESLAIDLWPEYDDPGVLVIYKAVLSPEVSLPAEITLRIPVEAGAPFAVAVGLDPSSIADVVYDTQVMGEWLDVSFIATTPVIQFEYYDPRLVKEDSLRTFDYTWPGDYAVNALDLQIQHPLGASNVSVTPTAGRVIQNSDGFTYNIIEVGALSEGSLFDLAVSYQKETDALSIESLEILPSATITPGTGSLLNLDQWWVWLLGILGIVLIGGGGFWYWRMGRQETTSRKRRHRKVPGKESGGGSPESAVYCHQCGKRAGSSDQFCRSCGTRLRTEER
jgi:hypothetical protein